MMAKNGLFSKKRWGTSRPVGGLTLLGTRGEAAASLEVRFLVLSSQQSTTECGMLNVIDRTRQPDLPTLLKASP